MEHDTIAETAYFESIAMGGQYALERHEAERRRQQRETAERTRMLHIANTLGSLGTRENFYFVRSGE